MTKIIRPNHRNQTIKGLECDQINRIRIQYKSNKDITGKNCNNFDVNNTKLPFFQRTIVVGIQSAARHRIVQ